MTPSHALLQKYPPEALDDGDMHHGAADVLAAGSCEELEQFLGEYQRRYELACREWQQWDDRSKEWDASFEVRHDEICRLHGVRGLIEEVEFEIVEIGVEP